MTLEVGHLARLPTKEKAVQQDQLTVLSLKVVDEACQWGAVKEASQVGRQQKNEAGQRSWPTRLAQSKTIKHCGGVLLCAGSTEGQLTVVSATSE